MNAHGHHDRRGTTGYVNHPSGTNPVVSADAPKEYLNTDAQMVPMVSPNRSPNKDDKAGSQARDKGMQRVRFDNSPEMVREIPHKSELTQQQKSQMWYNVNEFFVMKVSRCMALSRMARRRTPANMTSHQGQNPWDDEGCNFGLETPVGSAFRKEQKQQQVSAVLDEQELQREEGSNDPELLADVSFHLSEENQRYAAERGMAHAKEVKMLHDDSQQHDCPSGSWSTEQITGDDNLWHHQPHTVSSPPPCGMQHCMQQGTSSFLGDALG